MVISGKRAVAYFDILGFKAKLDNIPLEELSSKYDRIVRQTDGEISISNGQFSRKDVCYRYIFSDSLFLVAKEDTEDSFIDLVSYAWRLMQEFIAFGFPLRGAITYGDLYADLACNVFLGKAISEAVLLEGQQDWIGAVVDRSAINRYKSIFENDDTQKYIMNVLLPIHDVPFKDGTRKDYNVINWRINMVSEDGIKALFKNEPFDSGAQIKIDNTLRFSKEIVDAGMVYFNDRLVPERYRRLFVGHRLPPKGTPMFTNGDEY